MTPVAILMERIDDLEKKLLSARLESPRRPKHILSLKRLLELNSELLRYMLKPRLLSEIAGKVQ